MPNPVIATIENLTPSLAALFEKIGAESRDGEGITRDAFGARETQAAKTMAAFARNEGLETSYDHGGNLHITAPGQMASEPGIIVASHLDSVPIGGNYDGLAGVIAGVAVLIALQKSNRKAAANLRVLGFRGEESPWFGTAYLGSKLFLGELTHEDLQTLHRYDTGKSLAQHIAELGISLPSTLQPVISLKRLRAYFELHIEQAPLLENMDRPLGVATAIRGNIRYPVGKCFGRYAHSGAVPRAYRQDALIATAKLIAFADERWQELIDQGNDDLVFTCGIFHTDMTEHTMTKVPGEVTFSLNIGGTKNAVMEEFHKNICETSEILASTHNVRFDFGRRVGTPAVELDKLVLALVEKAGKDIGFALVLMPTVGHDAAMFQRREIPTSVLLIRNSGGSHNPKEHMEISDFQVGVKVLGAAICNFIT